MNKRNKNPRIRKRIKSLKAILFSCFLIGLISSFGYNEFFLGSLDDKKQSQIENKENLSGSTDDSEEKSSEDLTSKKEEDISEKAPDENIDTGEINEGAGPMVNGNIVLSFAGDCTLGTDPSFTYNTFPQKVQEVGENYAYFFQNVLPIFSEDDLTVVNLEGPLTNAEAKAEKKFTFKGPAEYAKILSAGSVEAANLANNHSMDYLEQGFEDTKKALDAESIAYFGLGTEYTANIRGKNIVLLGYKGWLENVDFGALEADIKKHKDEGSIVIANFHWGSEKSYRPNTFQVDVAHAAIDYGADIVIGHHPHVIQGLEMYKGKPIAYSLANFCFGGNNNPPDKRTFILQTDLVISNSSLSQIGIRVIPASISSVSTLNNYQPTPSEGADKAVLLEELNNLSTNLNFELSDEFTYVNVGN